MDSVDSVGGWVASAGATRSLGAAVSAGVDGVSTLWHENRVAAVQIRITLRISSSWQGEPRLLSTNAAQTFSDSRAPGLQAPASLRDLRLDP